MKKFFLALFIFGCGQEPCYMNLYQNVTEYSIHPNVETIQGIALDTGKQEVDIQELSNTLEDIELCLTLLEGYEPTPETQCLEKTIRPTPLRPCIRIKIVEPVFSECSEWHFLKEKAPQALCDKKGLEETKDCPCRWRWAVQDDSDLITPLGHLGRPYLYDIVKIHTGCNNYWVDKELVKCAKLSEE